MTPRQAMVRQANLALDAHGRNDMGAFRRYADNARRLASDVEVAERPKSFVPDYGIVGPKDEPIATAESVQDAMWRTAQRLLLIPAIVCAVLAAMVFFNKGIL